MIRIDELWVMQQCVERGSDQIKGMVDYIREGGIWTKQAIEDHANLTHRKAAPIYVTKFPDGEMMIHDGHKRVMSTYLGGRHYLLEEEYVIKPWTYESYDEVRPDRGFVTPFNPKTEVRLDDFMPYKTKVMEIAKTDLDAAKKFVLENHHLYAEPRTIKTVAELAHLYVTDGGEECRRSAKSRAALLAEVEQTSQALKGSFVQRMGNERTVKI